MPKWGFNSRVIVAFTGDMLSAGCSSVEAGGKQGRWAWGGLGCVSAWWLAVVPRPPWFSSPGSPQQSLRGVLHVLGMRTTCAVSSKCIFLPPAPETPPPVSSGLEPTSPAATLMILVGKGRRDISGHTRPGHQQRPPPWVSLTQPLVPAPPQGGQHPPPVSVWYLWSGQPWAPPLPSPRASAVTSTRRAPCGRSLSYTPA